MIAESFFVGLAWWQIYFATVFYFLVLYFCFTRFAIFLSKRIEGKVGRRIATNVMKKQEQNEIKRSLVSISVFGLSGVWTHYLYVQGLVSITWSVYPAILPEVFVLFIWNEIHFYICHWLLHRKWMFRKIHFMHHQSHVPTAYSAFSFHWIEALLLSTVMIAIMLFYSFSYVSLLLLPVMSLFLNVLGHWDIDLAPDKSPDHVLRFSYRHSLHHSKVNGNYGFFLPLMDKVFKTSLTPHQKKINPKIGNC